MENKILQAEFMNHNDRCCRHSFAFEYRSRIDQAAASYSNRTICPDSLMVVPVGNMEFEKRKFGQADESTFVNLHQHL
ncbi:hypothetical protein T4A_11718 [Trichinella pseudospiralis]|uniref:Uncharacterized protein n=1 Tax=Trichinella pseudospiralis TaxID=6337 RepID=A0A0V1FWG7_TRIPS|nr:hypothetical protein T4A_11718 [Trichinella pseudospiralis]KRY89635.1 hypothetical protein T4D_8237 [Trichinella pseudospiralis]